MYYVIEFVLKKSCSYSINSLRKRTTSFVLIVISLKNFSLPNYLKIIKKFNNTKIMTIVKAQCMDHWTWPVIKGMYGRYSSTGIWCDYLCPMCTKWMLQYIGLQSNEKNRLVNHCTFESHVHDNINISRCWLSDRQRTGEQVVLKRQNKRMAFITSWVELTLSTA